MILYCIFINFMITMFVSYLFSIKLENINISINHNRTYINHLHKRINELELNKVSLFK